jgi:hypothetical protein
MKGFKMKCKACGRAVNGRSHYCTAALRNIEPSDDLIIASTGVITDTFSDTTSGGGFDSGDDSGGDSGGGDGGD